MRPCVYILASRRNGTLYVGVTKCRRDEQSCPPNWLHRSGSGSEFVRDYRVHRLVHVEFHELMPEAIVREKQLKKWRRAWKLELIERGDPQWRDLSEDLIS